jgi:hypothetical protein
MSPFPCPLPSLDDFPAFDPRHVCDVRWQFLRPMRRQHPVVSAARAFERAAQFFPRSRVETVEDLVEEQHASFTCEGASDEREAALPVRQSQHASAPQARQPEPLQHAGNALPLRA